MLILFTTVECLLRACQPLNTALPFSSILTIRLIEPQNFPPFVLHCPNRNCGQETLGVESLFWNQEMPHIKIMASHKNKDKSSSPKGLLQRKTIIVMQKGLHKFQKLKFIRRKGSTNQLINLSKSLQTRNSFINYIIAPINSLIFSESIRVVVRCSD